MNKNTTNLMLGTLSMALKDKQEECDILRADLKAYKSQCERFAQDASMYEVERASLNDEVHNLAQEVCLLQNVQTHCIPAPVSATDKQVASLRAQLDSLHDLIMHPDTMMELSYYLYNYAYVDYHSDKATGKVKVVKAIHEITGWGIIESRDFVESHFRQTIAPSPEKEEVVIKSVKCIEGYDDVNQREAVVEGNTYNIVDIAKNGNYRLQGQECYWSPSRFEDVVKEKPTLKQVRYTAINGGIGGFEPEKVYDVVGENGTCYLLRGMGGPSSWWERYHFEDVEPTTLKQVRYIGPNLTNSILMCGKVFNVDAEKDNYYHVTDDRRAWIWCEKSHFEDVEPTLKRVRCIDNVGFYSNELLMRGTTYTVSDCKGAYYKLEGVGNFWWDVSRFENVEA